MVLCRLTSAVLDNTSLNSPNFRRPLSGRLRITILAVENVDHAATIRGRAPETTVLIKVEDPIKVRTRPSRNDRWNETFDLEVDKANEAEITVYDKSGDHNVPIGIMWMRLSDIAEELRRKKTEAELAASGWVAADQTRDVAAGATSGMRQLQTAVSGNSLASTHPATTQSVSPVNEQGLYIDEWFVLEPTGRIRIRVSFTRHNQLKRTMEHPLGRGGLGRQGAIRQRKEEVHEMYGHKFVQQQFYNVMRCAFCGEFLKYSSGYQCEDCKYTCHKKCYAKVVTKCISKSSSDTDPEEEKINHRIPHRFEPMTNMGANWCCHCGYILPLGKRTARKCKECGLTCHADCVHLVPDFCGMSMETANKILQAMKDQQTAKPQQKLLPTPSSSLPSSIVSTPSANETRTKFIPNTTDRRTDTTTTSPYAPRTSSIDMTPTTSAVGKPQQQQQQQDGMSPRQPQPAAQQGRQSVDPRANETPPSRAGYTAEEESAIRQQQAARRTMGSAAGSVVKRIPVPANPQKGLPRSAFEQQAAAQAQQILPQRQQQQIQPQQQQAAPRRKIGLDDFNFLAVLGKGNFGKVMLAEAKMSKSLYAIKVLKKEYILETDGVESTRSEKRVFLIANRERHPFLLNLHSCFQTETRVYFVMDYISGGDLMWHIQKEQFSAARAQFYAAEVCLGLMYFHQSGVIYRDLKLDNILLTLDGHVKIADYGLCKENMEYGNTTSTFCGTPELMAPEIIEGHRYGRAVDWWAFGVLIYQMILGQSPFRGDDEQEIFGAILSDEPLYPINMARHSVSILQALLTRDPSKRLGSGPNDARDVMAHPYFANINWDEIYHRRVPPPYIPKIDSPTDTRNFDQEFTAEVPVLTPVTTVLTKADQEQFRGFSYLNSDAL